MDKQNLLRKLLRKEESRPEKGVVGQGIIPVTEKQAKFIQKNWMFFKNRGVAEVKPLLNNRYILKINRLFDWAAVDSAGVLVRMIEDRMRQINIMDVPTIVLENCYKEKFCSDVLEQFSKDLRRKMEAVVQSWDLKFITVHKMPAEASADILIAMKSIPLSDFAQIYAVEVDAPTRELFLEKGYAVELGETVKFVEKKTDCVENKKHGWQDIVLQEGEDVARYCPKCGDIAFCKRNNGEHTRLRKLPR